MPASRTVPLPQSRAALQLARATVREVAGRALGARAHDAEIIVTEMVGNALRHGRPPVMLWVDERDGRCRIAVQDKGRTMPSFRAPGEGGGWGLHVIERLADRWGVVEGSTHIWCELDTTWSG